MPNINWIDLGERAGWTVVQAFAGVVVAASSAAGFGGLDWRAALLGAGSAGALSVLKSLGVGSSSSATAGAAQALTTEVMDALASAVAALPGGVHPAPLVAPPLTEATPLVEPTRPEATQSLPLVAPAQPDPASAQPPALQSPPAPPSAPQSPASSEASIGALSAQSAQ